MNVVITGPTGTIGMALIKKCIEEKVHVLAICHKSSDRIRNIQDSSYVKIIEADLSEISNIVVTGGTAVPNNEETYAYDVFYHLAWAGTVGEARNDMYLQNQNVKYTLDAVRLAKRLGCHTFVGAGSQAEYGRVDNLLTPQTPTYPENGYGMGKLCAGQMSRKLCEEIGLSHIWVRILSVYGPYDGSTSMISSTLKKLCSGEHASFTPGEQMWDYLYSDDAANALYLLATKADNEKNGKFHGKIYVLGSGTVKPLKEYILNIYQAVKDRGKKVGSIGLGEIPYSDSQVMYLGADITALKNDVCFEPKVCFEQGIRKMLDLT